MLLYSGDGGGAFNFFSYNVPFSFCAMQKYRSESCWIQQQMNITTRKKDAKITSIAENTFM